MARAKRVPNTKTFAANEKVIANAFLRFRATREFVMSNGMRSLLREAVRYAIEVHDEEHQRHPSSGDDYGWVLFYKGKYVDSEIYTPQGGGAEMLGIHKVIRKVDVPTKGWVGVVMAHMKPMGYFSIDYELEVLARTADEVRANFDRHFKPFRR